MNRYLTEITIPHGVRHHDLMMTKFSEVMGVKLGSKGALNRKFSDEQ